MQNTTWPLFTVPDFEVQAATARNDSQALMIAYLPLITDAQRTEWERYSIENQGWIQESNGDTSSSAEQIRDQIWTYPPKDRRRLSSGCNHGMRRMEEREPIVEVIGSGPFSPVWQVSPPPPLEDVEIINYNLFDRPVFRKAVDFIEFTKKAAFLDVCEQTAWFGAAAPDPGDDPQTVIVEPVFDGFENAEIVGHLVAVIPWTVFFDNTLNEGTAPVSIVMENTCDEVFSYEASGFGATL
jgi:hypothetical protein